MRHEAGTEGISHIRKLLLRSIEVSEAALLKDTGNTPEQEASGYSDWRWSVFWDGYSIMNDSVDEFCQRIEEDERRHGVRIIPSSSFLVVLEVKQGQPPTNFWNHVLWRSLYYGYQDSRLQRAV